MDNIVLPNISELQNTLSPWLISKSKYCEVIDSENSKDANAEKYSEHNRIVNNVCRTVENGTQYDTIPSADISIQCNLLKNTVHRSYKYTQCVVPNITIHTQTNRVLTKSSKVQCSLVEDTKKKVNYSSRNFGIQTEREGIDKTTQYPSICNKNCQEADCKCCVRSLCNIKQEPQLLTPTNLSLINSLDISLSPNKNSPSSPVSSVTSPISISLLTEKRRSRNVIVCKQCHQVLYTKASYNLHKKVHMVCSFCKRKFFSMKRANRHIENDCEIKKIVSAQPFVQLPRLESLRSVREKYSTCFVDLKNARVVEKGKLRRTGRMRSRSTSSVDSSYSCCSLCRSAMSVLHGLKLGRDKSVQTNMFDNRMKSGLVNGDVILKMKFKSREAAMSPPKKIRLSNSLLK